ncbi:LuxR C-terminal-related transcriptional regulator [Streptomyces sp. NPDC086549]|uniref:LuxR C-terminal-related transcriptional regulator n=1 Tax=Streptomyces sp. NPDC086549 TaxID=3365752 RepID=UPI0038127CC4
MVSTVNGPTAGVGCGGATTSRPTRRSVRGDTVPRRVSAAGILRGRTEEMTTALHKLRATARGGHGQILIVTGEPGMGKSALAHAIVAEAGALRFRTGAANADAIGQLSPGAPLLLSLRHGPRPLLSGEELADLVAQVDEPLLLLEAVGNRLETAIGAGPALLLMDDLEGADQLTRFLLRSLPFRLASLPIVWLLVGRTAQDTVLNDLSALSGSRAGQIAVERMELQPLSTEAILDIAHDRLGAPPPAAAAGLLVQADGSPFLAMQVIDTLTGTRGRVDEVPAPSTSMSASVPRQVAQALHRTLLDLGPRAVDMIQVLAVLGQPATPHDVQELTGLSPVETAAVLDEAIGNGVLDRRDGRIEFRYRLVRKAVYADLTEPTRRALHRRCATQLVADGAESSLVAVHAREGIEPGETECAAIVLRSAAELAAATPQMAGELAMTAFRALRPTDPAYLTLGEQCVRVLGLVQRCDDAIAVADLVLAHLDDGEPMGRIELVLARALWLAGRWESSSVRCASALARSDLNVPTRARLTALQTLVESRLQGAGAMRPQAEAALAEARRLDDREAHVAALHALAEITRNSADHTGSLSYFRQLRGESQPVFFAQEIMALQHLDRYRDAEALLKQAWSESAGLPASVPPALLYAQILQDYDLGRLDDAEAGARALLALARELGSRMYELEAASIVSMVALNRGRSDDARNELALDGNGPTAADEAHAPPLLLTRGWLTAAEGEPATAIRVLSPLVRSARAERDAWPWKPGWLPVLAAIGVADEDAAFLEEVQSLAEIGAARNPGVASFEGIAAHIQGLVQRDGDLLHHAVDVLATGPRPLLLAGTREDLGRHLLGEQQRSAGIAQLDQAWEAYRQAGAVGPMLRVQQVLRKAGVRRAGWAATEPGPAVGWAALTEAERTVARLMGTGYSNKQVAAELRVSTNTVGTHARSIFAKLGVRSRAQLSNQYHDQIVGA